MKIIKNNHKWSWHHMFVFILTFFSYAFLQASRKAYSDCKNTMKKTFIYQNSTKFYPSDIWQKEYMLDNINDPHVFFGELDTLFMFAYATGLFISGTMGDRLNLRLMLTFGMCSSAFVTFLFGYLSDIMHMHNKYYYYGLFFLNGLFQSIGWPVTVAIMGNWFGSGGFFYGLWGGNGSVGNIIGSVIVSSSLSYGYPIGILLNSYLLFCGGLVVFFCLITHPNQAGFDKWDEIDLLKTSEKPLKFHVKKAVGFTQAFSIPGVAAYSISYAFVKMVNYVFMFWLPIYLTQTRNWVDEKSNRLSCFYDIGAIFGGIVAGILTDAIKIRSPVICSMLLLSMGSLYFYGNDNGGDAKNVAIMSITGFLIGGPDNIICTAIAVDLGNHDKVKNKSDALATVSGIIDGTGSFGAALGQFLVPVISNKFGWIWVFYFLVLMTGCSIICILPILKQEISSTLHQVRKRKKKEQKDYTEINS